MKIQFAALESFVNEKRPSVNAQLYAAQKRGPSIKRFRVRSKGESEALTVLVLAKNNRLCRKALLLLKKREDLF